MSNVSVLAQLKRLQGISLINLQEFRTKVQESARTADVFTKLYYESMDKKRHVSCLDSIVNPSALLPNPF